MDELTKDEIQKRFNELPPDVRRAIQSSEVQKHIQEVGRKHQLHVDQTGILEDETLLVMLGFADPQELGGRLAGLLRLPKEAGNSIAQDIGEKVFIPIRESMRRFMEQGQGTAPAPAPESQTAAQKLPLSDALSRPPVQAPVPAADVAPKTPPKPATPAPAPAAEPRLAAPVPPQPKPQAPLPRHTTALESVERRLGAPAVTTIEKIDVSPKPAGTPPPAPKPARPADPYREPIE